MFSSLITSRIVATLSALLVILVGCGAGIWQLNRADQKIRLGDSLAAKLQMPVLNVNADSLSSEQASERRILARGRLRCGWRPLRGLSITTALGLAAFGPTPWPVASSIHQHHHCNFRTINLTYLNDGHVVSVINSTL